MKKMVIILLTILCLFIFSNDIYAEEGWCKYSLQLDGTEKATIKLYFEKKGSFLNKYDLNVNEGSKSDYYVSLEGLSESNITSCPAKPNYFDFAQGNVYDYVFANSNYYSNIMPIKGTVTLVDSYIPNQTNEDIENNKKYVCASGTVYLQPSGTSVSVEYYTENGNKYAKIANNIVSLGSISEDSRIDGGQYVTHAYNSFKLVIPVFTEKQCKNGDVTIPKSITRCDTSTEGSVYVIGGNNPFGECELGVPKESCDESYPTKESCPSETHEWDEQANYGKGCCYPLQGKCYLCITKKDKYKYEWSFNGKEPSGYKSCEPNNSIKEPLACQKAETPPDECIALGADCSPFSPQFPGIDFGKPISSCSEMLGETLTGFLKTAVRTLQGIGCVLAVMNGMLSMASAVASKDKEKIQKAGVKCVKLFIALALILLLPTIIRFIGKVARFNVDCI